jgi:hypothetical protein
MIACMTVTVEAVVAREGIIFVEGDDWKLI